MQIAEKNKYCGYKERVFEVQKIVMCLGYDLKLSCTFVQREM